MDRSPVLIRGARVLLAALAVLVAAALQPGLAGARPSWGRGGHALYVSSGGSDAAQCTRHDPCATIGHAVDIAPAGGTIVVGPGSYPEQVGVSKRVRLIGVGHPVVDATGRLNGIVLDGPGAAGSRVKGFVVENADQEGILASDTSRVAIVRNVVRHNDLGAMSANPTGECAPQGEVPGDCGEGLHLMSVTHAFVSRNIVHDNAGGILLTDELGPTAYNVVYRNKVFDNAADCGITVAGHNSEAVASDGSRQPGRAGIYRNWILGNRSDRNGLAGEGAGILLAGAGPGTGVYDNTVARNRADGNSFAGITLHSHAPGDDLNGNRFLGNRLSDDNLNGDPDAMVSQTTGILIFSAVSRLRGIVVVGNVIRDVHFGIWTQNAPAVGAFANLFLGVDVPVFQR